jgi:hypothetical protein
MDTWLSLNTLQVFQWYSLNVMIVRKDKKFEFSSREETVYTITGEIRYK